MDSFPQVAALADTGRAPGAVADGDLWEALTHACSGGSSSTWPGRMTASLVVAIWGVARDRLVAIVGSALSTVCGPIGC